MDKSKEELMEKFIPKLQETINNDMDPKKYGHASKAGDGDCLQISRNKKNYKVNIPFRTKKLKVEAIFNIHNPSHYFRSIQDNWSEDKHEFCNKCNFSIQQLEDYEIEPRPAKIKKADSDAFVKIVGSFDAQIESNGEWDNYIAKVIELIKIIIPLADFEFEKYPCEGSED